MKKLSKTVKLAIALTTLSATAFMYSNGITIFFNVIAFITQLTVFIAIISAMVFLMIDSEKINTRIEKSYSTVEDLAEVIKATYEARSLSHIIIGLISATIFASVGFINTAASMILANVLYYVLNVSLYKHLSAALDEQIKRQGD